MITKLDRTGTMAGLQAALNQIQNTKGVQGIVVLAGNNPEYVPEQLDPILKQVTLPLVGGVYTAIMYNNEVLNTGTIVAGLADQMESAVIPDLSNDATDYDELLDELLGDKNPEENETLLVFADGYSSRVGSLVDSLFNVVGVNNNFIGGGAGYYHPEHEMKAKPCVFTNEGIRTDAAVLGILNTKSKVEVQHGWKKVSEPFRVTETKDKAIVSIDWQPAFPFYCKQLEAHSGKKVTRDNFFEIGKKYSLGLHRIGTDVVVREPIAVDGDSMLFTVPVPNEAIVYVINGAKEPMVDAVSKATILCTQGMDENRCSSLFVVDCISRYYFHGNDFIEELDALNSKDLPVIGVLSIGEIANTGKSYVEVYNKTCVVGLIC